MNPTYNWYVVIEQRISEVVPTSEFPAIAAFTYVEFKTREECRRYRRELKAEFAEWEDDDSVTGVNIMKRTTVTDHMGNDYFTETWVR